jgi:hypothetical protein
MANTDIFSRQVELGPPMSADAIRVILSRFGTGDLLMQSITFKYEQAITRLWELGSHKTFMFAGRTEGSINAKRVIGPSNASLDFIADYGDVCNMAKNNMTLEMVPGCGQTQYGTSTMTASGCVVNSVTYTVQAQDKIIYEDLAIMFVKMEKG